MTEWKLKSCPRCSGDIYVEKDNEGCYERCLQCGYVKQIYSHGIEDFARLHDGRRPVEVMEPAGAGSVISDELTVW